MATNFLWKVNSMSVTQTPEPNFVARVEWSLIGTEGLTTCTLDNIATFDAPSEDFTPYEDLTEDVVLGWVKDQLGPDGVAAAENTIASYLFSVANPPSVPEKAPLPWG